MLGLIDANKEEFEIDLLNSFKSEYIALNFFRLIFITLIIFINVDLSLEKFLIGQPKEELFPIPQTLFESLKGKALWENDLTEFFAYLLRYQYRNNVT